MTKPTVYRQRAELLLNLAKVTLDAREADRLRMLAAAELDRAADLERRAARPAKDPGGVSAS